MDWYRAQEIFKNRDITTFAREFLGMPVHPGQDHWFKKSWKLINILKPANQWGKTTAEAMIHIFHACAKPMLSRFDMDYEEWMRMRYETLNFGKTYEVAKGISEAIVDIVGGNYLLPDGTLNKSLLKGWAIIRQDDAPKLPQIVWWNNSRTLIRSYDGLGESFKRKRLAFVSGDECGDVPELRLFLNGTLIPRIFFFQGPIHLIGTPQPKGLEYEEISQEAEESYLEDPEGSDYFVVSYNVNPQMASIYRNDFMGADYVRKLENIADPQLKKQVIEGQYVEYGKRIYTWDEVNQMFTPDIPYDHETGYSEAPHKDGYYVFSVDMAASEDETSCTCIKYNRKIALKDGSWLKLPHKVVFHKFWKGSSLPLSLQYEIIKQYFWEFKNTAPRTAFVYDAGSLGGKNAEQAFSELHGYPFPPKKKSYADAKAEGMGKVKEVLGRNRSFTIAENGKVIDKNPDWGGVRASSEIRTLRKQIEIASKDDDKIKNDQYTSFMQGIHFIESRVPKTSHTKAIGFNYARGLMGR